LPVSSSADGPQTLINVITGERKSSSGTVWRHPNLRMAYVAQHAFHHLEEHLDTTPLKYMFKRFGMGMDQVRCVARVFEGLVR
jgi:elongation factor 3